MLETCCSESGFAPRVPFEINEIETIRALVGSGTGIALLPATETTSHDVVAVPLSGDRARDIALVSARHRPTAPVERFRCYILSNSSLNFPIEGL
jgi:DNA-binding transcriptional LysR family regulator